MSSPTRPPDRSPLPPRALWLIAAGCVFLVWVLSGFALRAFSSGEILDGTTMVGIELGGESRQGAAKLIADAEPQKVKLTGAQETITVRAPQAGLTLDAEGSAESAYSAGRTGIGALLRGPLVLFGDREVEPSYEPVKSKRLNRTVNRIADEVDREPFVGALSIDDDTLDVTIGQQPKAGVRVIRDATRERLLETFQNGRTSMSIPTRSRPAPSPAEVEKVAREAERYLRRPLRIRTAGGAARFTPEQLSGVLSVESADDPDGGIRLGADQEKVASLVAGLAGRRDRPAQDAGLDTPPLPPVNLTEQGDLSWQPKPGAASVRRARIGRRIRQDLAMENMTDAIRNDQHRVRFPTETVEPDVNTKAAKNATSLLGTFTTSFSCCEPRVENIQQMAQTVDGTVIGPGEQFSLNGVAGERTRANGYKPAPTIGEGNRLIDTVGGGVSQFSTTTYNAAYFAGLQIDSHTPHSFYIDRYPAGRESTLNYGTIDLLWTNDTNAPVVVRSSASDTAVTVSIYGGNGGRRVRAVTRSRSDNSQGGFDITVDRVIVYGDGKRTREPFTTIYGLPGD